MTVCATCSTDIPAGAEVYVATEADALTGPMTFLCRECADADPRDTWSEPHLPTEETLPEGPPNGEASPEGTLPEGPADPVAEVIGGQDPPGDTYNREQAGKVLGVSARRVSQLATEGRLLVVQESPLRVSAESVHALRAERRGAGRDVRATVPPDPGADVAAQVERVVSLVVAEHRKAIEAGESLLAEVTAQRDDYRAEAERLRAEVEAERVARAEAERLRAEAAERPRRWWQR